MVDNITLFCGEVKDPREKSTKRLIGSLFINPIYDI